MCSLTKGIFIVSSKRTPFGTFGGKLVGKSPVYLQVEACKAALTAANINPEIINSTVIGNVLSASSNDAAYISRHVALQCGVPVPAPALTVNRLCGSGFQSVVNAAQEIMLGDADVVLTGGSDSMSDSPYALRGVRFGTKLGVDYKLDDLMWSALTDANIKMPMGITAENLADKYNITREDADAFAIKSQTNWQKGQEGGFLADEMAPIMLKVKGKPFEMNIDEHPKPKSTVESIARLPSVFKKGGTVTAATASGICDGAGASIVASEEACGKHGLKPLARLVGYAVAGVEPHIMGIGPAPAITKLLTKAGLKLSDVGLVEINEAFAAQTIACQKELDLDPAVLNMDGGAIAIGHPLAASGARITAHVVHALRKRNIKYGIGSACIGGGQGIALLIENIS